MDLNDNRLAQIARGDEAASAQDVTDIAAELLRLRRLSRQDSRRALQVRRLRWAVENVIVKVEMWFESAPASNEQLLGALSKLADKVGDMQKDVRALPLELEDIGVAHLVAKWLRSRAYKYLVSDDLADELAAAVDRGEWKEALHG